MSSRKRLLGLVVALLLSGCRPRPLPSPLPPSPSPSVEQPAGTPRLFFPFVASEQATATVPPARSPAPPATEPVRPPQGAPSPTPLPPPVPKPDWGLQVHLFGLDVDQVLTWARGTGVGWIKQQVEWTNIEHAPGQYDWAELDRIVDKVNGYGFKLLLGVNHAPAWMRTDPVEYGPPHDPAEFGRFMGLLAARYRGRVAAYELWNEPNLRREWRGEPLDPALFVALVQAGSEAIRAADPDALVISGAPAVTGINDGVTAVDDRVYLRGMLAAGVARWVDGIGVHPYGFANPPEASWRDAQQVSSSHNDHPSFFFRDTLEDYRALLVAAGAGDLPLWVTEFGWPSVEGLGLVDVTGWEYAREVTEEEQAAYIVRAFRWGDARPWVGPMFLWNLNIAPLWGPSRPESAYSLLRPDGSYRPAYIALRLAEEGGREAIRKGK